VKTSGNQTALERAGSPEQLGISSQSVIDFLDDCEKNGLELHSFMLLRHGKVAAECWWKPFAPNIPHTMFSFSKSVTAAAVGFAIDEGKLALDTKVYALFPEYAPIIKKKWQDTLTVEHLLTMTSGKMTSILINTQKIGWVQSYLRVPFKYKPGEKFEYVTDNSFMLAAIVKRVTGQGLLKYLTPRLFEPLGIKTPVWETNQQGVETGGWGLFLKTEDQAKFVQCLLDDGKWGGRQVIPEFWAKTVGQRHVPGTPGVSADHASGYGYHFWLNQIPNSYRCDGVFSQLGLVMKDQDICIVTTGGEPLEDKVLETVWRHFTSGLSEHPLPENPETLARLRRKIASLHMPVLPKTGRRPALEQKISGKLIKFRLSGLSTVLGTVDNAISTKRSGGFNNVRLTFEKDRLMFFWTEKYDENTVAAGYNGKNIVSKGVIAGMKYDFASSCAWREDGSLEFRYLPLQHAQVTKLVFSFEGQNVRMKMASEKGLFDLAQFGLDFKGIRTDDLLLRLAKGATELVEPLVDPDLNGRFA